MLCANRAGGTHAHDCAFAAFGAEQAADCAQQRGLAHAVLTEQAVDAARFQFEAQILEHDVFLVVELQVVDLYDRVVCVHNLYFCL